MRDGPRRQRVVPRRLRVVATSFVLAGTIVLGTAAGCSSSSGSGGSANSSSNKSTSTVAGSGATSSVAAGSAGVQKATAAVQAASAAQRPFQLPPLPHRPVSGKTVGVVGCSLPICTVTTDGVAAAAKAVGWKTTLVTSQFTPESYVSAFNQLVTIKPDFVVFLAIFPNSIVQKQLQALHDHGTKVVGMISSSPVGPLMAANFASPSTSIAADTSLEADVVVADAGKPVHVLYVTGATTKATFQTGLNAFNSTLKSLCPQCASKELDIDVSNIGRLVPSQIVSALQRDPAIKYVVSDSDDYFAGVYAALQSAGLAKTVKLIGRAPSKQSLATIRSGQELATVADENSTAGWRAVDALARLGEGVSLGGCCVEPPGWKQILTKDNVPLDSALASNGTVKVPGDPSSFIAAWHLN